jgi:hypothetical protein
MYPIGFTTAANSGVLIFGPAPSDLFRRARPCEGGAAESPGAIRAHRTGKIQSHHGNVKCLDLTLFPIRFNIRGFKGFPALHDGLELGLGLSYGSRRANDLDCGRARLRKAFHRPRRRITDGVPGAGTGDT